MILASLLATTVLITLAKASPMSYSTYRRREIPVDERPELLLLYDQRGLESADSSSRSGYDIERDYGNEIALRPDVSDVPNGSDVSTLVRNKRVGLVRNSLSIVNPVDVLRQRVLLELARRRAMQEQHQVDANRRMLETIGKRSIHQLDHGYPRNVVSPENDNEHVYTNERQNDGRHEQYRTYTQRVPLERTREWYDFDDTAIRGGEDDETRKVLSTYHRG